MLKLGRVTHKKTKRAGRVILINPANKNCLIYFDIDGQHGERHLIKDIRNINDKRKTPLPLLPFFQNRIRAHFTSKGKEEE